MTTPAKRKRQKAAKIAGLAEVDTAWGRWANTPEGDACCEAGCIPSLYKGFVAGYRAGKDAR